MQATIFLTNEAFSTSQIIKDLDHNERAQRCDEDCDFASRPGYHLKNANKLRVGPVPSVPGVRCVECVESAVIFPENLRGCIFEGAPNLPPRYAEIVQYWSGPAVNATSTGAVYYQNPFNEYMVELGPDAVYGPVVTDRLLSEGIVVAITGLRTMVAEMALEDFVELHVPLDEEMLGIEPDAFRSSSEYDTHQQRFEKIFLKVSDIMASPDLDHIYIDLLCNELIDYGYWY
jgi:hypothetical protein